MVAAPPPTPLGIGCLAPAAPGGWCCLFRACTPPPILATLSWLQVDVEVEGMDKAGNFIGWLHADGANLSVALVEQGLSKVHFTAERSPYCKPLMVAEAAARQRKEKVPAGHRGARGGSQGPFQPHGCSEWGWGSGVGGLAWHWC